MNPPATTMTSSTTKDRPTKTASAVRGEGARCTVRGRQVSGVRAGREAVGGGRRGDVHTMKMPPMSKGESDSEGEVGGCAVTWRKAVTAGEGEGTKEQGIRRW